MSDKYIKACEIVDYMWSLWTVVNYVWILQGVSCSPTQRDMPFVDSSEYVAEISDTAKTIDELQLSFTMGENSMELHLERNKGLKLNVPVVYGKEMKLLLRGAVEEEPKMAVYSGADKEASVIVKSIEGVKHYNGHFSINNQEYKIDVIEPASDYTPAAHHHGNDHPIHQANKNVQHMISAVHGGNVRDHSLHNLSRAYKLYESRAIRDWIGDTIKRPPTRGAEKSLDVGPYSENDVKQEWKKRKYDVEMLFIIDYSIFKEWYNLSQQPTPEAKKKEALKNIQYYYTHIANGVSMRYRTMTKKLQLDATLSGFYIATTLDSAPWTRDNTQDNEPKDFINGDPTLRDLQDWLEVNSAALPSFDQATLFIDNYLKGWSGNSILGMAIIEGMCSKFSTAIARDVGQYSTIQTITHEMAHNIGAYHDGDNNTCTATDQYIMAPYPVVLTSSNFANTFMFSHCTIEYFKQFLQSMDKSNFNCLENKAYPIEGSSELLSKLPGQEYSPDEQCTIIFGTEAYYCGGGTEDISICFRMECFDPAARRCVVDAEQRAATGTTCGNNKWCSAGLCVTNPEAPAARDYCTYGDYKGWYTDGRNCQNIGTDEQWLCYSDYYSDDCCMTCAALRNNSAPDCAYGDKAANCSSKTATDCLDKDTSAICCKTCPEKLSAECVFGDTADWCSNYINSPRDCYIEGRRCCQTCSKYKVNLPNCTYGDEANWCPSYVNKGQLCYTENYRCCATCYNFRVTNISGCEFGDHISECATRSCNDIYAQQHCCHTCHEREQRQAQRNKAMQRTTKRPLQQRVKQLQSPAVTKRVRIRKRRRSTTTTSTTTTTTTPTTITTPKATYPLYHTTSKTTTEGTPYIPAITTPTTTPYPTSTTEASAPSVAANAFTPSLPDDDCRDRAEWCPDIPSSYCYTPNARNICCATCKAFETGVQGCEFGNRFSWCTERYCNNSYDPSLYNKCCGLCWPKTSNIPPPTSGCLDGAVWCTEDSFSNSFCYDDHTRAICCHTCATRFQPQNIGCEYGDRRAWCSQEWCETDSNLCCNTCQNWHHR